MKNPSYVVSVARSVRDESVGHLVVRSREFFGTDCYALLDAASYLSRMARIGRAHGFSVRVDPLEVSWFRGPDVVVRNFEIQLVEGRIR